MINIRRRRQFRPCLDALGARVLLAVSYVPPEEYPTTPTQDAGNYPGAPTYNPTTISPPSSSTTPDPTYTSAPTDPRLITPPTH